MTLVALAVAVLIAACVIYVRAHPLVFNESFFSAEMYYSEKPRP